VHGTQRLGLLQDQQGAHALERGFGAQRHLHHPARGGLGVLGETSLFASRGLAEPYRPWFMSGEPSTPWWAADEGQ